MAYVLEVTFENGEIKYINSTSATVYCPEYAARYDDKKCASTIAAALQRSECYKNIEIKQLSHELCLMAYKRNLNRSYNCLYPDDYK